MGVNAGDDAAVRLKAIRDLATTVAPKAAVTAMAHLGVAATVVQLSRTSHGKGEPTSSAAGSPPAWVSGSLARSIIATPAIGVGAWASATIGPTIIYGRIQELGGKITAKGGKKLAWQGTDGMHFAKSVKLPARPYLRPTTEALVASGKLMDVAAKAFTAALGSA